MNEQHAREMSLADRFLAQADELYLMAQKEGLSKLVKTILLRMSDVAYREGVKACQRMARR